MKNTHVILMMLILTLSACEMPEQRGLFGQDELQGLANEIPETETEAEEPEEEEEFRLMGQYSQEDLALVDDFVTIREAIAAVKKSIAGHPEQGIKTGFLFGGISMLTTTHSGYWFKDGTLYSVNPFARAYSPELPHAPGEINDEDVRQTAEQGTELESARDLESPVEQQFGEFLGLVAYVNGSLLEKDENATPYTYGFLKELGVPISREQELDSITKFRALFKTIAQEQPETFEELNIAQSLTIYTFGRAKEGMTHAQVAQILGSPGENIESAEKDNVNFDFYAWRGPDVSNLYVFFRNDELSEKIIAGYN